MDPSILSGNREPFLITSVVFSPLPGTPGSWKGESAIELSGESTVLVEFDARGFPFDRYCRYVRTPDGIGARTFDKLEFADSPPGIRLGPWPGWRGIPDLPRLTLSVGEATVELRANLFGGESAVGLFSGFCTIRCEGERTLVVTSEGAHLIPVRADVYRTSRIRSTPTPLLAGPAASGHPRLLITPQDLTALKARRTGSHAEFWKRLEKGMETWEIPFSVTPTSKAFPGPQRLAGEDRLMLSAFAAIVDPSRENVARALGAFRDYRADAGRPDFAPLGIDTQAGETLFQLCVGYDWLQGFMEKEERRAAAKTLLDVARICRRHLDPDRRDYGQAHYLGCGLGLFAYSLLFKEDYSEARAWSEELRGALDCALRLLPEEGAYPHGINLWIYEFSFLLRWIEILRTATGEDLWHSIPALKNVSAFRAATLSSNGSHSITFGDPQFRTGGDSWIHFLLARRTRSGVAQWVGNTLLEHTHEGVDYRNIPPRRRVYEFLYYDPSVVPLHPDSGVSFFSDTGQLFHRSESRLFTFRAGPPLGRKRYRMGEYGGYGHSDPSNGSFLLHSGADFLISGPGPVYRRDTSLHNVVTIDGAGQTGDSTVWLPDFLPPDRIPSIPSVRTFGNRSAISWNGTSAYLPHLGLRLLTRALFVDLEQFVIGYDVVECDRERSIEWNCHSWGEFIRDDQGGRISYSMCGGARLAFLSPLPNQTPTIQMETGKTEFIPAYPNDGTQDYRLTIAIRSAGTAFLWALMLRPQPLPQLTTTDDGIHVITCGDGTILHAVDSWLIPGGSDAADS